MTDKNTAEPYELVLEPDHLCSRDDPKYLTVSDWYRHHIGRVPIIMAWKLSQRIKTTGETFAEAWTAMVGGGSIILIEPDAKSQKPQKHTPKSIR